MIHPGRLRDSAQTRGLIAKQLLGAAMLLKAMVLPALLITAACSGGGGGGGGGGGPSGNSGGATPPATIADQRVITYATVGIDGSYAQVDLIHGGNPESFAALDAARRTFFNVLTTTGGTDLNGNISDTNLDGIPDGGFETYLTGLPAGSHAQLTLGANNLYDLLQTSTGPPKSSLVDTPDQGFQFYAFTGGDLDSAFPNGNAAGDGGPGLFSNVPGSIWPKLPTLPHTMGTLTGGSGRGPSPTDQHQFIQIEFPYNLDVTSLFNAAEVTNSFLGDSKAGATRNVFVEARWVQRPNGDAVNAVDQSLLHRHVPGVAIIGGVAAVPIAPGLTELSQVDAVLSNLPAGALPRVFRKNVLTYIAHEDPNLIIPGGNAATNGLITVDGTLVLPSPSGSPGGGRVFGATTGIPGSVNDFTATGDQNAAPMGFVSFYISNLRNSKKSAIANPYFHTFPVSQAGVGTDPRAVSGSFNRGPAVYVDTNTQVPHIDILSPQVDAIGSYNLVPSSDAVNTISTRARFLVRFDKEVVPNSVGFSRRHTLHSTAALGEIFRFNGNTRPVNSPAGQFSPGKLGSPLAPSIYLAINQPAGNTPGTSLPQKVNSPRALSANGTFDSGAAFPANVLSGNGLTPQAHNTLATLPRGVVPVDIYPLNQNNLNAYVVQPLIEMPPGSIVTLGVCRNGLGHTSTSFPSSNRGNFTRSGTLYTTFQGLSSVGLFEDASLKQVIVPNDTIIKVNAGPMDLQGLPFYGGTSVAFHTLVDGNVANDLTTGGYNVSRTFRVGFDNEKVYVNAPVSPQAIYLGFNNGGLGVLDLSGTGYTTNRPGGSVSNVGFVNYLEVSRFLPPTLTGKATSFNWSTSGSFATGDHQQSFGIIGRYTSGGTPGGPSIESELAIGAAIPTGSATPVPGINEGSSGYESIVFSAPIKGNAATSTAILAGSKQVGIVRDIEVGNFLDTVYFDPDNAFATPTRHRTYNAPLQGSIANNTIADPPLPNPPPLRYPVGLPHTAVIFDQSDLAAAPFVIDGNEVFTSDAFMIYDDGTGFGAIGSRAPNGYIQLNPTTNSSNNSQFDKPHKPNAGFNSPFGGISGASQPKYVQTGPMPRTATAGALILAQLNAGQIGTFQGGGLVPPIYQSRQQIGNFLFVADGVNKKLHALNSNNMTVIRSLSLPDPYGLGLTPDLELLMVTNEGNDTVSVVDADPTSPAFMTELKRIPVGGGPRAVAVAPSNDDAFVLNYAANTISIVSLASGAVRKTLSENGLNRPYDIAIGAREGIAQPGFQSGTYHGYVSNFGGNNVLIYESGPTGLGGLGVDNILGAVKPDLSPPPGAPPGTPSIWQDMLQPRGISFDPTQPLPDGFGATVGCFVAHQVPGGRAAVTRIAYTRDVAPGGGIIFGNLGGKVFEVTAQYISSFAGVAYDVALPDFNRQRLLQNDFGTFFNLFNAGATLKNQPQLPRNTKYPLADNITPTFFEGPRWDPDRLYLSIGKKLVDVFDISSGAHLNTISTPQDVAVMGTYFSQ